MGLGIPANLVKKVAAETLVDKVKSSSSRANKNRHVVDPK